MSPSDSERPRAGCPRSLRLRLRPIRIIGLLILLALLAGASVLLYIDGHNSQHHRYLTVDTRTPDRIVLIVTVQKIDPATADLTHRVLAVPQGVLVRPEDDTPSNTFEVKIGNNADPPLLRYPARQPIAVQTVTVSLANSGTSPTIPSTATTRQSASWPWRRASLCPSS